MSVILYPPRVSAAVKRLKEVPLGKPQASIRLCNLAGTGDRDHEWNQSYAKTIALRSALCIHKYIQ